MTSSPIYDSWATWMFGEIVWDIMLHSTFFHFSFEGLLLDHFHPLASANLWALWWLVDWNMIDHDSAPERWYIDVYNFSLEIAFWELYSSSNILKIWLLVFLEIWVVRLGRGTWGTGALRCQVLACCGILTMRRAAGKLGLARSLQGDVGPSFLQFSRFIV